jgi:hypothetical protein
VNAEKVRRVSQTMLRKEALLEVNIKSKGCDHKQNYHKMRLYTTFTLLTGMRTYDQRTKDIVVL